MKRESGRKKYKEKGSVSRREGERERSACAAAGRR